jgi:hypothetical protein
LNIPELQADFETGMGVILFPPDWFNLDPNIRVELLNNWIYALARTRASMEVQIGAEDAIRKAMKK